MLNKNGKIGIITFVLVSFLIVGTGVYWSQFRAESSPDVSVVTTTPVAVVVPDPPTPVPSDAPTGPITPDIPCADISAATPASDTTGGSTAKAPPKADVLFLLDATGSMGPYIEGVKHSIKAFVAEFQQRNIDAHVGLIAFRDRTGNEEPQSLLFNGQVFTTDTDCFSNAVGKLVPAGGGDTPESDLDALVLGAQQHFRKDAGRKVIVLITDAPPKIPDKDTQSIDVAVRALRENKITFLYFIVNDAAAFGEIKDKSGMAGGVLPLADAVNGNVDFERLLPEIAKRIAKS